MLTKGYDTLVCMQGPKTRHFSTYARTLYVYMYDENPALLADNLLFVHYLFQSFNVVRVPNDVMTFTGHSTLLPYQYPFTTSLKYTQRSQEI